MGCWKYQPDSWGRNPASVAHSIALSHCLGHTTRAYSPFLETSQWYLKASIIFSSAKQTHTMDPPFLHEPHSSLLSLAKSNAPALAWLTRAPGAPVIVLPWAPPGRASFQARAASPWRVPLVPHRPRTQDSPGCLEALSSRPAVAALILQLSAFPPAFRGNNSNCLLVKCSELRGESCQASVNCDYWHRPETGKEITSRKWQLRGSPLSAPLNKWLQEKGSPCRQTPQAARGPGGEVHLPQEVSALLPHINTSNSFRSHASA